MAGTVRSRTDLVVAVCAATFVAVLAISAYWDRSIRVLHAFESVPYVAAAVLCLRQNTFGYALGAVSGAFWLWMAGFLTAFVHAMASSVWRCSFEQARWTGSIS